MKEQHIFSKNSTYQLIEVLKTNRNKRYRQNCFLVEGVRSLNEAVKNGWTIRSLVYRPEQLSGWAKDMIRSCDALGADALILTGHGVDLYDPDVVVSAMGSFFNLPVLRITENNELYSFIAELKEKYPGFITIGTTAHRESPIWSETLSGPLMLMVGNETMGLNKAFKENCDKLCTIPMAETSYASSFNVSCAASIMMYEIVRQRNS